MKLEWPQAHDPPLLESDAVHVWAVPLTGERVPRAQFDSILSAEEQTRASRFLRPEAGRSFAVARAGLRTILGRYLNAPPAKVPLENAPSGKPQLRNSAGSDLQFNLAHSGEVALVAITRGGAVGVDVERIRPVDHWQEIASRYFHADEAAAIGADAVAVPASFFRCWTRKEAVLKASGVGIIFPLDAFCVPLDENAHCRVDVSANSLSIQGHFWLQSLDPCHGYVAAVATELATTSTRGFSIAY